MNAIIIDDEVSCIESLLAKIELFVPSLNVVKTYLLPQEALREINKMDVDVIFLDIEMPNMSGITFAQKANLYQSENSFRFFNLSGGENSIFKSLKFESYPTFQFFFMLFEVIKESGNTFFEFRKCIKIVQMNNLFMHKFPYSFYKI